MADHKHIRPVAVSVGVSDRLGVAGDAVDVGVLRLAEDVPAQVIGILPRQLRRRVLLPGQPFQRVIGVLDRIAVDRVRQDVPVGVIGIGLFNC